MRTTVWAATAVLLAACGQQEQPSAAPLGLEALSLHESGAGRVTYADMSQDGDAFTFTDVVIATDAGPITAASLMVDNLRGTMDAPTFDSLQFMDVTLSTADAEAGVLGVRLDSATLDNPSPAIGALIAAAFAEDGDLAGVLEPLEPQDFTLDAAAVEGFVVSAPNGDDAGLLTVAKLQLSSLTRETLDAFVIENAAYDGVAPAGPMSVSLESAGVNGLDATMFQEAFEAVRSATAEPEALAEGQEPTPQDDRILSALLSSGVFTDVYAKRYDSYGFQNLSADIAGAEISVAQFSSTRGERGGIISERSLLENLRIDGDPESGAFGQQMEQSLQLLGYEAVRLDFDGTVIAEPETDRMRTDGSVLTMQDGFSLAMSYDLGGVQTYFAEAAEAQSQLMNVDPQVGVDPSVLANVYAPLIVHGAAITFTDDTITDRAFQAASTMTGEAPEDMKSQAAVGLLFLPAMARTPGSQAVAQQLSSALGRFLEQPGAVTIAMEPETPVRIGDLLATSNPETGALDIDAMIEALGIAIGYVEPNQTNAESVQDE